MISSSVFGDTQRIRKQCYGTLPSGIKSLLLFILKPQENVIFLLIYFCPKNTSHVIYFGDFMIAVDRLFFCVKHFILLNCVHRKIGLIYI